MLAISCLVVDALPISKGVMIKAQKAYHSCKSGLVNSVQMCVGYSAQLTMSNALPKETSIPPSTAAVPSLLI